MLRILGLAACLAAFCATAEAQIPPPGAHFTASGPCAADRKKYCANVEPGAGRLVNCLEPHRQQLSATCKERMEPVFKLREKMHLKPGQPVPDVGPAPHKP